MGSLSSFPRGQGQVHGRITLTVASPAAPCLTLYRQYDGNAVHTLRFIRHSRDLGFSLAEIAALVGLWRNRRRPSRQVKALAQQHIEELNRKAQELLAMKSSLEHLVQGCNGDDRPECPILDGLAADGRTAPP